MAHDYQIFHNLESKKKKEFELAGASWQKGGKGEKKKKNS